MIPHEIVKGWLLSFRDLSRDIVNAKNKLDTLETRYMSPSHTQLTGMPRGNSDPADKIGNCVVRMEKVRDEISRLQSKQEAIMFDIQDAGNRFIVGRGYSDKRSVIEYRYILEMDWNDIPEALFGKEKKYFGHEETYLRRVYRLHKEAIEVLSGSLSEGNYKTLDEYIQKAQFASRLSS